MRNITRNMRTLAIACTLVIAGAACTARAVDATALTIYPSRESGLFAPGDFATQSGYAMVHQQRSFALRAGTQTLTLQGLAERIDPSALLLHFPSDSGVRFADLSVLSPVRGVAAVLQQAVGGKVTITDAQGKTTASGILRAIDGNHLLVEDSSGALHLVSGEVTLPALLKLGPPGQQASISVYAPRAGTYRAELVYPTAGIGWRANYDLLLRAGDACRGALQARATLANHSGTRFEDARVTLLAGAVQAPNGMAAMTGPRMLMAAASAAPPPPAPAQGGLADYRSYRLPAPISLAEGAVVQVPLYAPQTIECTRNYVFGDVAPPGWSPQQPDFNPDNRQDGAGNPRIEIAFKAPENLPSGEARLYLPDADGSLQFIGANGIEDTRAGDRVVLVPGAAYDLKVTRSRTRWQLAGKVLTEGLRYTLSNTGRSARTITVYAHPRRWRNWELLHSAPQPAEHGIDTLMWRVRVPADGSTRIDYTLRYDASLAPALH
ncbi:MAG: DUF4139 domain-containing protein [Metallibacterium sp.]